MGAEKSHPSLRALISVRYLKISAWCASRDWVNDAWWRNDGVQTHSLIPSSWMTTKGFSVDNLGTNRGPLDENTNRESLGLREQFWKQSLSGCPWYFWKDDSVDQDNPTPSFLSTRPPPSHLLPNITASPKGENIRSKKKKKNMKEIILTVEKKACKALWSFAWWCFCIPTCRHVAHFTAHRLCLC